MGEAVDLLIVKLGQGDVTDFADGGPFMPSEGYTPTNRPDSNSFMYVENVIFKHPKKDFHGRKAWRYTMLKENSYYGKKPITRVFRKGSAGDGFSTGRFVDASTAMGNANHCPDCGVQGLGGNAIKATFDADVSCSSSCLNATGHNCDCSCNGANHGIGWG